MREAPYTAPPDARCAASLLLLRDGAQGLEVLMLTRAERAGDQRSGVAVFPGGVLDAADREAHAHCLGPDDAAASALLGVAAGGLDYLVAAVRETFEEVGLLLAQGEHGAQRREAWRARLHAGQETLAGLCRAHGLRLDLRGLVYYSHWLTPPGVGKRFDTRFFVALAPAGQEARPDGAEALQAMWLTPHEALAPQRGLKLLPVTRRTLHELSRHERAAQALDEARSRSNIQRVMPRMGATAHGPRVVLPDELPYAEIARLDPHGRGDVACEMQPGRAVRLSARILRVTAPNPGPMTGPGTNSYLVGADGGAGGQGDWTVIDPGPAIDAHVQALLAACPGRIARILVTHTHRDHSPAAAALAAATGAPVLGRVAPAHPWQDAGFAPQRELQHGERLVLGEGADACTLRVIHTPGHASNHLCYLLEEEKTLFTGDHVMQGSTVVINPPDGDMAHYLRTLHDLLGEDLEWLAPGHGFLVAEPHAALRALIAHRLRREAKVLGALRRVGAKPIEALVARVYDDVPLHVHALAQRSLLAHLLKLQGEGAVAVDGGSWSAV